MREFVDNYNHVVTILSILNRKVAGYVQLYANISTSWLTIIKSRTVTDIRPCLMSDWLKAGLMSSKAFTELLLPPNDFQRTIKKWEKDLECTIEDFL